jgi:hypothetical protein
MIMSHDIAYRFAESLIENARDKAEGAKACKKK